MTHDHDDWERLTIGCPACIERVNLDQIVCVLDEWLTALDPFSGNGDELELPTLLPTKYRLHRAYRTLRSRGYDVHDVRYALAAWQIDRPVGGGLLL